MAIGGLIIGGLMSAGAGATAVGVAGAALAGGAVGYMAQKQAKAAKQQTPQLQDVKMAKDLDSASSSFTAAPNIGNKQSSVDTEGDVEIGSDEDGKKKKRGIRQLIVEKPKAKAEAAEGGASNTAGVVTKKSASGLVV